MEIPCNPALLGEAYNNALKLFRILMRTQGFVEALGGRTGGYATLADRESGRPLLTFLLGNVTVADAPKYHVNSLEKPSRLSAYKDHVLSRESRDPQAGKWGGAAKGKTLIASFSGFPEAVDEAFSLGWLVMLGELTLGEARKIAGNVNNSHFGLVDLYLSEWFDD